MSGASQVALVGKNPPANAGDAREVGSIPESGRSPDGGHGNPLKCPWLKNPMDREPGGLQSIESQRVGDDWSDLSLIRDTPDHSNSRSTRSCSHPQVLFTLRNEVSQSEGPNISTLEYLLFDWSQELRNTCLPATRKEERAYRAKETDGDNYIFDTTSQSDLVVTYESVFGDSQVY